MSDFTLFNDPPVVFDPKLAIEIGLNEAIVLQQIHYWLVSNERSGNNYYNGRYWTFNSIKKWRDDFFPWWSEPTVKRTFKSLEDKGILISGNFNKKGYDKTKWYTIDYQALYRNRCNNSLGQNDPIDKVKMTQSIRSNWTNALGQNDPTNTIDNTEITKEITPPPGVEVSHQKEVDLLKGFLGKSYSEEYAIRIINLLKDKGKDISYLKEKIILTESKNLKSKEGYLYKAIESDFKETSQTGTKSNGFQNFESTVSKYTKEELEEKMRQSQLKKFGI